MSNIITSIGSSSVVQGFTTTISLSLTVSEPDLATFSSISLTMGWNSLNLNPISISNLNPKISSTSVYNLTSGGLSLSWYSLTGVTFSGTTSLLDLNFTGLIVGSHSIYFDLSSPENNEYTDQDDLIYSLSTWEDGFILVEKQVPVPTTTTTTSTTTLRSFTDTYSGGNKNFASTSSSKISGLKVQPARRTRNSRFSR